MNTCNENNKLCYFKAQNLSLRKETYVILYCYNIKYMNVIKQFCINNGIEIYFINQLERVDEEIDNFFNTTIKENNKIKILCLHVKNMIEILMNEINIKIDAKYDIKSFVYDIYMEPLEINSVIKKCDFDAIPQYLCNIKPIYLLTKPFETTLKLNKEYITGNFEKKYHYISSFCDELKNKKQKKRKRKRSKNKKKTGGGTHEQQQPLKRQKISENESKGSKYDGEICPSLKKKRKKWYFVLLI